MRRWRAPRPGCGSTWNATSVCWARSGNNAPFIGLFGTVLGIIKAFADLARNQSGGAARRHVGHLRGAGGHRRRPDGRHPGGHRLQLLPGQGAQDDARVSTRSPTWCSRRSPTTTAATRRRTSGPRPRGRRRGWWRQRLRQRRRLRTDDRRHQRHAARRHHAGAADHLHGDGVVHRQPGDQGRSAQGRLGLGADQDHLGADAEQGRRVCS